MLSFSTSLTCCPDDLFSSLLFRSRDRDRDRERRRSRERSDRKRRSRSRDRRRSRSSERKSHRHRSRSRDRDRDRERSSKDKGEDFEAALVSVLNVWKRLNFNCHFRNIVCSSRVGKHSLKAVWWFIYTVTF